MSEKDLELLVEEAKKAMKRAYCPYSKFHVGAAILTKDGSVVTAGNVENASYGATVCAERSAAVRAVAEGHTEFKAIAVASAVDEPSSPCGICRQFLAEFGEMKIIMASTTSNKRNTMYLSELLPLAFSPKDLKSHATEKKK